MLTSHNNEHTHAPTAYNAALFRCKMWWHTVATQRQRVNRLALYCALCTIEGNIGNALNRDQKSFESCQLAADGRYPLSCLHLVAEWTGLFGNVAMFLFHSILRKIMTADKCNGTCEHTFFIGILGLWLAWMLERHCRVRNNLQLLLRPWYFLAYWEHVWSC